eukprot:2711218-Rhodomonas_salina.1
MALRQGKQGEKRRGGVGPGWSGVYGGERGGARGRGRKERVEERGGEREREREHGGQEQQKPGTKSNATHSMKKEGEKKKKKRTPGVMHELGDVRRVQNAIDSAVDHAH